MPAHVRLYEYAFVKAGWVCNQAHTSDFLPNHPAFYRPRSTRSLQQLTRPVCTTVFLCKIHTALKSFKLYLENGWPVKPLNLPLFCCNPIGKINSGAARWDSDLVREEMRWTNGEAATTSSLQPLGIPWCWIESPHAIFWGAGAATSWWWGIPWCPDRESVRWIWLVACDASSLISCISVRMFRV